MPEISKDIILLIQYLAPGFLSAWIFYGLTSHVRPSSFERVAQAVIYSLFIKIASDVFQYIVLLIGKKWSFGPWLEPADIAISIINATTLGFLLALVSNSDWFHSRLRKLRLSSRSAHPSEWCAVLKANPAYMVFHLKDERRLVGYPLVWPSDHEKGHFFITNCRWLLDDDGNSESSENQDSNHIEVDYAEGILMHSSDVKMIEILKEGDNDE
ncbi:DUF6338 family protein [Chitiniphilus eburneus]|uniref:Uncharacterized protein n=1 Tax=Chitiniphilus eburneus TaxID=2571148 RepID=A0A4V5MRT3_9NEIS|nr:DUF6338 family protein [Chitiniphilus eburneus]TJZ77528.1 hypothetical protein FAZ21_04130 [Chitiniphilus eburneus]